MCVNLSVPLKPPSHVVHLNTVGKPQLPAKLVLRLFSSTLMFLSQIGVSQLSVCAECKTLISQWPAYRNLAGFNFASFVCSGVVNNRRVYWLGNLAFTASSEVHKEPFFTKEKKVHLSKSALYLCHSSTDCSSRVKSFLFLLKALGSNL